LRFGQSGLGWLVCMEGLSQRGKRYKQRTGCASLLYLPAA